jgi:hypothetical protein
LVLADLGNEIYNNYGKALGLSPVTIASMGGMNMSGTNMSNIGSSMNMNPSSSSGMSGTNSTSGPAVMNQSNPQIKNITAYETSRSLASIAQQRFNKDFMPIAPATIEKFIDQMKNAVNSNASFMNEMELVHVKLQPTMITAYNLTIGP